jgi:molecular chaperone GrpE
MSEEKESNSPDKEEVIEALEGPENGEEQAVEEPEDDIVSPEVLAAELEDARKEARENWEKLLRAQAEVENLRRRTQRELQDAHKYALEKFAKELLPVMDSLELGIEAASSSEVASEDIDKHREGSELTLQQFKSVFEKFNIETVDPVGEAFNPEFHQAMAMEPNNEVEPNTVVKVFQKGYLLNQRLLRPAMVVVAQAAEPAKIDEQA